MTFKPFVGDEFRATFSIFNKAEQIRLFLNPPALSFPLVLTTKRVPRVRVCVCPHFLHTETSVWLPGLALQLDPALPPPPIQECCHGGGWRRAGSGRVISREGTWDGARPDATHHLAEPRCPPAVHICPAAPSQWHHLSPIPPPKRCPGAPPGLAPCGLGTETQHQFTWAGWQLGALVSQG